ncbi:MAG: hypothetical protein ACK5MQ_11475 [Pikeienuella sp.]
MALHHREGGETLAPRARLRILPEEVGKSLKILPLPTTQPVPAIIGSYWRCVQAPGGFDLCEPVIVFCTNDQSFCVEIP